MNHVQEQSQSPPIVDIYFIESLKKLQSDLEYQNSFLAVRTISIACVLLLSQYLFDPLPE